MSVVNPRRTEQILDRLAELRPGYSETISECPHDVLRLNSYPDEILGGGEITLTISSPMAR